MFLAKAGVEKREIRQANHAPQGLRWADHTCWAMVLGAGKENLADT